MGTPVTTACSFALGALLCAAVGCESEAARSEPAGGPELAPAGELAGAALFDAGHGVAPPTMHEGGGEPAAAEDTPQDDVSVEEDAVDDARGGQTGEPTAPSVPDAGTPRPGPTLCGSPADCDAGA